MPTPALCAILLVLAAGNAPGLESGFAAAAAQMGVELRLPPGAELLPAAPPTEVDYQLAFSFPGAKYEVRLALIPCSELQAQSFEVDLNKYVPAYAVGLLAGIAREDLCYSQVRELPAESVRVEFGADYGLTALIKGGNCDFSRGFRYVVVNVLYRKEAGLVVVYLLYNDRSDLGMDGPAFAAAYYCFRFAD
jgi:hypothetical protein